PRRQQGGVEDPPGNHHRDHRGRPIGRADEHGVDRRGEAVARQVPPHHRLEGRRRLLAKAPEGASCGEPRDGRRRGGGPPRGARPDGSRRARMQREVETAMRQGGGGVSSGLIYPPGSYAKTDELVALAKAAGKYGGLYASHIRGEDDVVLKAIDEAIAIGQQAQGPVEIWHLKVSLRKNWGRMKEVVDSIERARASGGGIGANMYAHVSAS